MKKFLKVIFIGTLVLFIGTLIGALISHIFLGKIQVTYIAPTNEIRIHHSDGLSFMGLAVTSVAAVSGIFILLLSINTLKIAGEVSNAHHMIDDVIKKQEGKNKVRMLIHQIHMLDQVERNSNADADLYLLLARLAEANNKTQRRAVLDSIQYLQSERYHDDEDEIQKQRTNALQLLTKNIAEPVFDRLNLQKLKAFQDLLNSSLSNRYKNDQFYRNDLDAALLVALYDSSLLENALPEQFEELRKRPTVEELLSAIES